jgi:hypothetical protein
MFIPTFTFTAQAVIAAATRAELEIRQYVALPDDSPMELDGYITIQHKTENHRRYLVILPGVNGAYPEGKCTCPAWAKANGVCKHIFIGKELAEEATAEEAMIADLYEREEARDFMLNSSREHNIGFSAEVYDEVAGTFPA